MDYADKDELTKGANDCCKPILHMQSLGVISKFEHSIPNTQVFNFCQKNMTVFLTVFLMRAEHASFYRIALRIN